MTKILEASEVKAMVKALKLCPSFKIVETDDTIKALLGKRAVFSALKKDNETWIVRHVNNLFE